VAGPERMTVELDLLVKYNTPGARRTTYRVAPHFHSGFGADQLREEILATNAAADAPDLSLYVHFPFCPSLCHYCGCTVVVTRDVSLIADYLDDLRQEIELLAGLTRPDRRTVQLQWGGGTPNYLSPAQIRDVFGHLRSRFALTADAEVGIEIDPRQLGPEHLGTIRDVGFNCVTFGVQDLDPRVQQAVNRVQPEVLTKQAIAESRALGFDTVCVDLIYGLPHQTESSLARTLEQVAELAPDRVAVFGYGHIPRLKAHQRALEALPRADQRERLRLFKTTIETLTGAGYVYVGMDQFALPGDRLAVALAERNLYRNLQGYREALRRGRLPTRFGCRLDPDDRLRGHVVRELVSNGRIDKQAVAARFGVDFDDYFADSLASLDEFVADGLLACSADRIELTERGRPFLRNIMPVLCRRI